jgi:dipeptidyl aminopeptidase/acylaminoacyl peptidase
MNARRFGALALLLGSTFCGGAAAQSALPPPEAFGSIPAMRDVILSPDGGHLAAIQELDGKPAAVIYDMKRPGEPVVFPSADGIVQGIEWAKNDRLLVFLGKSMRTGLDPANLMLDWGRTMAISPDGSQQAELFKGNIALQNNVSATEVTDLALDDPTHIYMPLWVFDRIKVENDIGLNRFDTDKNYFHRHLYRVDLASGHGERIAEGSTDTIEWYTDGHGNVAARVDQTHEPLVDHVMVFKNGEWKEIGTFAADSGKGAIVLGLSDDGKRLIRGARAPSGMQSLVQRDLQTNVETPLFSVPGYDVSEALVDPWTRRTIGGGYSADKEEYKYFDPSRQALQNGLEAAFPGQSVNAVSFDLSRDKVIAEVDGPQQPPAYYIVDRTTHQATLFGSTYPKLHASDLGEMKSYAYKARDGLTIPAYITLRPGRTPKGLPAIVMPHGGPDDRDEVRFDWWAQFFANRGYVVLQPNFRGSWGYGKAFSDAGLQQWGLKMNDDVSDGVKRMIADGVADPKRVCIVGWSYGGYAALAGATFSPDLYACAVSMAGVSDLPHMLQYEKTKMGKRSYSVSFWTSRIGSIYDDSDQLRATSPARHADQVRCPVLLLHGENDSTVPIDQSETMESALKSAGKQVEFVRLEGDDHYLEVSATRIQMLTAIEKFLKANIGS